MPAKHTACEQVFATPELLEGILHALADTRPQSKESTTPQHYIHDQQQIPMQDMVPQPATDLFLVQRVSKTFYATIHGSPTLLSRMWLAPSHSLSLPQDERLLHAPIHWILERLAIPSNHFGPMGQLGILLIDLPTLHKEDEVKSKPPVKAPLSKETKQFIMTDKARSSEIQPSWMKMQVCCFKLGPGIKINMEVGYALWTPDRKKEYTGLIYGHEKWIAHEADCRTVKDFLDAYLKAIVCFRIFIAWQPFLMIDDVASDKEYTASFFVFRTFLYAYSTLDRHLDPQILFAIAMTSACERVFAVAELLEQILLALPSTSPLFKNEPQYGYYNGIHNYMITQTTLQPPVELFKLLRVSTVFRNTILCSKSLRLRMWLSSVRFPCRHHARLDHAPLHWLLNYLQIPVYHISFVAPLDRSRSDLHPQAVGIQISMESRSLAPSTARVPLSNAMKDYITARQLMPDSEPSWRKMPICLSEDAIPVLVVWDIKAPKVQYGVTSVRDRLSWWANKEDELTLGDFIDAYLDSIRFVKNGGLRDLDE